MRFVTLALTVVFTTLPTLATAHPVVAPGGTGAPGVFDALIHLLSAPDHAPLVLIALASLILLVVRRGA